MAKLVKLIETFNRLQKKFEKQILQNFEQFRDVSEPGFDCHHLEGIKRVIKLLIVEGETVKWKKVLWSLRSDRVACISSFELLS